MRLFKIIHYVADALFAMIICILSTPIVIADCLFRHATISYNLKIKKNEKHN